MAFKEFDGLDLPGVMRRVLELWREEGTFRRSVEQRAGKPSYLFYEGPPSANGMPGIHHVLSRSIKDTICRYKTQRGYRVERKAGWDTHGLPVELGVEQMLGITKEDIGGKISVQEYNATCRREVMRYTDRWRELTERMGYWVDLDHPYITYQTKYIESLWYLLSRLYEGGYLYKGKTIQPYSPAAGTGLSTHELNQPGCYRDVSDTTVVAQFRVVDSASGKSLLTDGLPTYFLAWTTTPWTLPSNTALAVGEGIEYAYVRTLNPYTLEEVVVILAVARLAEYFKSEGADAPFQQSAQEEAKGKKGVLPWREIRRMKGAELVGMHYCPVLNWVRPPEGSCRVIPGDFVSTEDGTGIVHIAPTFGADDARVARQHGVPGMEIPLARGENSPFVDRRGRFLQLEDIATDFREQRLDEAVYGEWAGRYVREEYAAKGDPMGGDVNVDICVDLKKRGLAFRIEKHKHSYPHCWRTDKPILYYPLDAWFIRTTAFRERLLELNETINWKPASTGSGRFGKWLENLVDWNLSRSRFWGTPLPIWATDDGAERLCIGSLEQLYRECDRAVAQGLMRANPLKGFVPNDNSEGNYAKVDLHRPFVDDIVLASKEGKPMHREPDLVDVWFDSGAMPYAQWHYPFERKEEFERLFPADFIAEGVDQTRGWFFTLHALSTMLFDSVAFRNIISNGLVLDREGNKMSKRLGNAIDPFQMLDQHGADAVRWYMLTNAQPWENLRLDEGGIGDVSRRFFGTLHNTYAFFSLYANVDGWEPGGECPGVAERCELDRWVLSRLQSLVGEVTTSLDDYDPTRAGRAIQDFVTEHLSNWYVRLNRKRFWGGTMTPDKQAAYHTLYTCLETVVRLMAPLAPFYADELYRALHGAGAESVHLSDYPTVETAWLDPELERRMELAQRYTSLVLALRRKVSIKVRQPLARIMLPVLSDEFLEDMKRVESILLQEVNVKSVEYLASDNSVLVKRVKPDYRKLGPRAGAHMKQLAARLSVLEAAEIQQFERQGYILIAVNDQEYRVELADVEIVPEDIPGWLVMCDGQLTAALDIRLTPELEAEGAARELVNRVQNLRKDSGFDVVDRIAVRVECNDAAWCALEQNADYMKSQVLALELQRVESASLGNEWKEVEVPLEGDYGTARVFIRCI